MAISDAMNTKLNEQIKHEFGASQAYLAMACMFADMGLESLAMFFRKQTEEERQHALKILDYVLEIGGKVKIHALEAPTHEYPTAAAAIEAALAHEHKVTRQIHDLVALADKDNDYPTRSFLQWFVDEQVEEVSSMDHLAKIARMASQTSLLHLDAYVRHRMTRGG